MKLFFVGCIIILTLLTIITNSYAKDGVLYNVLCYSDNTQTYVVEYTNKNLEEAEALVETGREQNKDCFLEEINE